MNNRTLVLVGNPNSGKTTLFNGLTGSDQRIGNWPGVTVEKKQGSFSLANELMEVIDLPGAYTLNYEQIDSLDERIAANYINDMQEGVLLNVVDASNLERHLYLTIQLLEHNLPMIVVLTMMDKVASKAIDVDKLSEKLGVPVVAVCAHKAKGLDDLYTAITHQDDISAENSVHIPYPKEIKTAVYDKMRFNKQLSYAQALTEVQQEQQDADIVVADARYGLVREICKAILTMPQKNTNSITKLLDKLFLNRFLGLPFFLFIMYLMFFTAINVGGAFQECLDLSSEAIFVNGLASVCLKLHMPDVITAILAYGLGKGLNTVLTFIPVIGAMFLFLSFLEGTGYMARAAFVVDRFMRKIGLPGKAFVPLIVGFGCNVPGVMATRTLESEKDRILTAMMSPFMSCSARLAIFTVFVSVFFPHGGHNIVFALYLIGILVAIITGFFLRGTLLDKSLTPLLMELPAYHMPRANVLLRQTWGRLKHFVKRAGRVIVPVCMCLGALNVLNVTATGLVIGGEGDSVLSYIGKFITPIFEPIGLSHDNWPATVGLLMGTLAKEVVIATLNTLYSGLAGIKPAAIENFQFWPSIVEAFQTIPANLSSLGDALVNPIWASRADQALKPEVAGTLSAYFPDLASVFAYLLFVLLYVPCISTMAAIKKELNHFWMYFSLIWTTVIAYMTSAVFYQMATIQQHYMSSILFLMAFAAMFYFMQFVVKKNSVTLIGMSQKGCSA